MMADVAANFAADLDVPLALAVATEPAPLTALSVAERHFAESLRQPDARNTWLTGRAALKALAAGETSALTFPHASLSLTHSAGMAVAVRADARVGGIGVDFEPWRAAVRPAMARFFLRRSEQDAAQTPRALVRLWTIKEALFKACPGNDQCVLLDFELSDAQARCGTATGPGGLVLRYVSADVVLGSLSVAVTLRGNDVSV